MRHNLSSNNQMDIFDTRRAQLRRLIKEVSDGNQAAFAKETGIKAPQINRWLSSTAAESRNITEPSARSIEKKAGKTEGWLDQKPPSATLACEPEPPTYIEFDANIRAVIAIMKRVGAKEQEKIVWSAQLVEAEYLRDNQNSTKRAGQ